MQTKLTLRLDDELIQRAKAHAAESGRSVSQLVADYFSLLGASSKRTQKLTPKVKQLKGALRGKQVDVDDYKRYLEDKYL